IFGYNYYKEDSAYGVIRKPITKQVANNVSDLACPICGSILGSSSSPLDLPSPSASNNSILPSQEQEQATITRECPECGQNVIPEMVNQRIEYEDEIVKWEETTKG